MAVVTDVAPGEAGAEGGEVVGPPVVVDGPRAEVGAVVGTGVPVVVVGAVVEVVVVVRTGATAGVVTTA